MSISSDQATWNHPVGFIDSGWTERVQIPAFTLGGLTAQAISSARPENARRVAEKFDLIPGRNAAKKCNVTLDRSQPITWKGHGPQMVPPPLL